MTRIRGLIFASRQARPETLRQRTRDSRADRSPSPRRAAFLPDTARPDADSAISLPLTMNSRSGSKTTKSASYPAAIRPLCVSQPASRAGPADIHRARSSNVNPRLLASVHIERQRDRKARNTTPGGAEIAFRDPLHRWRTRRMVGDDHVDRSVSEALPQFSRDSRGCESGGAHLLSVAPFAIVSADRCR